MSDVISNQIYEVRLKVEETVDDFIFQTIQPFCESIVKRRISKKELEDMLLRGERMKWTPCNKRLPDDDRKVLVTIKRTETGKSRYMIGTAEFIRDKYTGREVWNSDEYGVVGVGFQDHVTVTAWMELPKTYKEDTQDE